MGLSSGMEELVNRAQLIEAGFLGLVSGGGNVSSGWKGKGGVDETGDAAIIPIVGPLSHRINGAWARFYGGTSYESIKGSMQLALSNPATKKIVFDIDSPGGDVAGCFDFVDQIYAARGQKKIYAVINETCFSAAYAIASAAERIYMARTARVGSIGVICLHCDMSKLEEKIGVRYTAIFSGDRKNDFSPHEPLNAAARKEAQEIVDTAYGIFCNTVARNRGISEQAVRASQAGVFAGQQAVTAGLADRVCSFGEAIKEIMKGENKMIGKQVAGAIGAMDQRADLLFKGNSPMTPSAQNIDTPPAEGPMVADAKKRSQISEPEEKAEKVERSLVLDAKRRAAAPKPM